MDRRIFLGSLLAAPALLSTPAHAKKISLNGLSNYLNGIKTAKAQFTQVNPDNSLSKGVLYIHRPGRIRFEYAKPNPALVIAGGGQVAIFDKKSNAGPQQYPLSKTPLNMILKGNVNLSQSGMVKRHTDDGVSTKVLAQDPKRPDIGSLELVFTDGPTQLRQWIVTDQQGRKTTVILGSLKAGVQLSPRLFSIQQTIQELKQG